MADAIMGWEDEDETVEGVGSDSMVQVAKRLQAQSAAKRLAALRTINARKAQLSKLNAARNVAASQRHGRNALEQLLESLKKGTIVLEKGEYPIPGGGQEATVAYLEGSPDGGWFVSSRRVLIFAGKKPQMSSLRICRLFRHSNNIITALPMVPNRVNIPFLAKVKAHLPRPYNTYEVRQVLDSKAQAITDAYHQGVTSSALPSALATATPVLNYGPSSSAPPGPIGPPSPEPPDFEAEVPGELGPSSEDTEMEPVPELEDDGAPDDEDMSGSDNDADIEAALTLDDEGEAVPVNLEPNDEETAEDADSDVTATAGAAPVFFDPWHPSRWTEIPTPVVVDRTPKHIFSGFDDFDDADEVSCEGLESLGGF